MWSTRTDKTTQGKPDDSSLVLQLNHSPRQWSSLLRRSRSSTQPSRTRRWWFLWWLAWCSASSSCRSIPITTSTPPMFNPSSVFSTRCVPSSDHFRDKMAIGNFLVAFFSLLSWARRERERERESEGLFEWISSRVFGSSICCQRSSMRVFGGLTSVVRVHAHHAVRIAGRNSPVESAVEIVVAAVRLRHPSIRLKELFDEVQSRRRNCPSACRTMVGWTSPSSRYVKDKWSVMWHWTRENRVGPRRQWNDAEWSHWGRD